MIYIVECCLKPWMRRSVSSSVFYIPSPDCSGLIQGWKDAEVADYLEQKCRCGISALALQGEALSPSGLEHVIYKRNDSSAEWKEKNTERCRSEGELDAAVTMELCSRDKWAVMLKVGCRVIQQLRDIIWSGQAQEWRRPGHQHLLHPSCWLIVHDAPDVNDHPVPRFHLGPSSRRSWTLPYVESEPCVRLFLQEPTCPVCPAGSECGGASGRCRTTRRTSSSRRRTWSPRPHRGARAPLRPRAATQAQVSEARPAYAQRCVWQPVRDRVEKKANRINQLIKSLL